MDIVHQIIIPKFKQTSLTSDSEVSVCFERGGKIAASRDKGLTDLRNGTAEVAVNETLSLVITMYKGANEKYQVSGLRVEMCELKSHLIFRRKLESSSFVRKDEPFLGGTTRDLEWPKLI